MCYLSMKTCQTFIPNCFLPISIQLSFNSTIEFVETQYESYKSNGKFENEAGKR
jgi:hypothetical protein